VSGDSMNTMKRTEYFKEPGLYDSGTTARHPGPHI
jgi:hypothetical protein